MNWKILWCYNTVSAYTFDDNGKPLRLVGVCEVHHFGAVMVYGHWREDYISLVADQLSYCSCPHAFTFCRIRSSYLSATPKNYSNVQIIWLSIGCDEASYYGLLANARLKSCLRAGVILTWFKAHTIFRLGRFIDKTFMHLSELEIIKFKLSKSISLELRVLKMLSSFTLDFAQCNASGYLNFLD